MANPWCFLVSLVFILIVLMSIHKQTAAAPTYLDSICSNETTFHPNSAYDINLKTLLISLTSNASTSTTNFYATLAGEKASTNFVYGLFLCRGDLNTSSCKSCVEAATLGLQNSYCPWSKVAVIWYNECMVRYSDESLMGKMEESPKLVISNSQNINMSEGHSRIMLQNMMKDLAVRVTNNESGKKFEMKGVKFTNSHALYMLGQCTPDLTTKECALCLKIAINLLPVGISGRVLQPSCSVWYETSLSNFQSLPMELILSVAISPTGKDQLTTKVIIIVVLPMASISLGLLVLCLVIKKSVKNGVIDKSVYKGLESIECFRFDLITIQRATSYFSDDNKLAEGFFGSIYKGTLPDGREVAVKSSSNISSQTVQDFNKAILLHSKLQHRNFTEFIGFCLEGGHQLIINEYCPNPNLHYFLTDPRRRRQLDWRTRYQIIKGIASGILYLDEHSRLKIIHCDIRPGNILLDADMNAKISHFGVAVTTWEKNESQIDDDTFIASYGYMSMEEKLNRDFSIRSNVFCFGVLLLLIITSERYINVTNFYEINFADDLLSEAWKKWREGTPLEFVDPILTDSSLSNEVLRCMHLGLLCIQESPDERPTMASVVFMLNHYTTTDLPVPQEPAFFFRSEESLKYGEADTIPLTINDASISKLHPR